MKKLFSLLALCISLTAVSQISITNANMPVPGDTLRFSTALLDTSILLNYQNSGANLTWNFDSLRVISQTVQEFENASQTVYSAPQNSIGLLFADTLSFGGFSIYDAYNFLENSTSDFSIVYRGATAPTGLSFPFPSEIKLEGAYSDKDEVFQFPLNFGDRDSSTFDFLYTNSLAGIYYGSKGYRINDVDAWGTITTPYGTFNTIRVVSDMVSYDTVSFSGQNFGINSHTREYQWISDQERIAVMKVNGQMFGETFIPTTVEFRDSARVVEPLLPIISFFRAVDSTVINTKDTLEFLNFAINNPRNRYKWSFNPSTVNYVEGSSTARDIKVNFPDTGFYDVQLAVFSGSRADSTLRENYIQVISTTDLQQFDLELSNSIVLFPNPSQKGSSVNLEWNKDLAIKYIEVLDIKGSLIETFQINANQENLILETPQQSGVYFLKMKTENAVGIKKLVVE